MTDLGIDTTGEDHNHKNKPLPIVLRRGDVRDGSGLHKMHKHPQYHATSDRTNIENSAAEQISFPKHSKYKHLWQHIDQHLNLEEEQQHQQPQQQQKEHQLDAAEEHQQALLEEQQVQRQSQEEAQELHPVFLIKKKNTTEARFSSIYINCFHNPFRTALERGVIACCQNSVLSSVARKSHFHSRSRASC